MPRLTPCPSCHSHVLVAETSCPHCGASLQTLRGASKAPVVLMGLALAGCPVVGEPEYGVPDPTTDSSGSSSSESETGMPSTGEPEYGVPETDTDSGTSSAGEPEYGVPDTDG